MEQGARIKGYILGKNILELVATINRVDSKDWG